MEGTVKWFNTRKGYGFVKGEDDEDYFVHYSALPQGVYLRENDKVSFEPVETDRGKQAQNVTLLQKGSEAPEEGKESEESQEPGKESDKEPEESKEPEEEPKKNKEEPMPKE